MKKLKYCLFLICFSGVTQAASINRAQYFSNTENFFKAFTSLTKNYNLKKQTLISGPYLDYKTNEEFIVIEVEDDKCRLITSKKTENVSCNKAIEKRMDARVPMLTGHKKAGDSQLNFLESLNSMSFEAKVTVHDPYIYKRDISFFSTLNFDFSSDLKSLKLNSETDTGSAVRTTYPTLRVKGIQYKKNATSESVVVWVDRGISFYSQEADKGAVNYLNPKLFKVKKFDDLVDLTRDKDNNVIGVSLGIKDKFKPMISSYDFNYIVIKRDSNESKLTIEFQQSFKSNGSFSAEYSTK